MKLFLLCALIFSNVAFADVHTNSDEKYPSKELPRACRTAPHYNLALKSVYAYLRNGINDDFFYENEIYSSPMELCKAIEEKEFNGQFPKSKITCGYVPTGSYEIIITDIYDGVSPRSPRQTPRPEWRRVDIAVTRVLSAEEVHDATCAQIQTCLYDGILANKKEVKAAKAWSNYMKCEN